MLISLIVPCYNEEEAMPLFYQEAARVAAQMEKSHGAEFEIIFVDDGSKDGTLRVARELHDADPRVRYVSFSRNFGKEAGIYAGLKAAKGDYVATLDADLQDPPALLPDMLDALLAGDYDCAATRRTTREGEPPVRSWFARMFYRIINKMSDTEIVDGARDFRLMSRRMVDAVLEMSEYNRFSKGIFSWVGFKTKWFAATSSILISVPGRNPIYRRFVAFSRFGRPGTVATISPFRSICISNLASLKSSQKSFYHPPFLLDYTAEGMQPQQGGESP